ncbi:unnamed protein product, partial [marine sediment metagenome]
PAVNLLVNEPPREFTTLEWNKKLIKPRKLNERHLDSRESIC